MRRALPTLDQPVVRPAEWKMGYADLPISEMHDG